jgi:hyperosmotically inducible protein
MTNTTRNLLAASLAVGMLLGTSAAMAQDPPKTTDHPMTHADKHESTEPVSDTWITAKVKGDLVTSKAVSGTDVKVETVNGVVSLSGTVATQAEHDNAIKKAKAIKGVKSVDAGALTVSTAAAKR